jgi:hypothetical protein
VRRVSLDVFAGQGKARADREEMGRAGFSAQYYFRSDNVAGESRS